MSDKESSTVTTATYPTTPVYFTTPEISAVFESFKDLAEGKTALPDDWRNAYNKIITAKHRAYAYTTGNETTQAEQYRQDFGEAIRQTVEIYGPRWVDTGRVTWEKIGEWARSIIDETTAGEPSE